MAEGKKIESYEIIANHLGTSGDDTVIFDGHTSTVTTYGGNDSIVAGKVYHNVLSSFIDAGAGNDTISVYSRSVTVDGGKGDDYIENFYSAVSANGGAGNDTIYVSNKYSGMYTNQSVEKVTLTGGGGSNTYKFKLSNNQSVGAIITDITSSDVIINDSDELNLGDLEYSVEDGNLILQDVGPNILRVTLQGVTSIEDVANISYVTINETKTLGEIFLDEGDSLNIEGTSGADNIYNTLDGATINAYAGNDTITNSAANVQIFGGAGNDKISNDGSYSKIDAGDGADTIQIVYGDYVTADGGADNDVITTSYAWYSSIAGGAGADKISLGGGYSNTINAGTGNDTLYNYNSNLIQYANGDGNDVIYSLGNSTLNITSGSISNATTSGNDVILTVGNGTITLKDKVDETIYYKVGSGSVQSTVISAKDPLDVQGTSGADNLSNTLNGATINAYAGNDTITNYGDSVAVYGGDGADSISNSYGYYSTINGGAGADTISLSGGSQVIQYANGDGNDIIYGVSSNDTLQINSAYNVSESGNNILVSVGSGKITINGNSSSGVVIQNSNSSTSGGYSDYSAHIVGTPGANSITNKTNNALIQSFSGNDTITVGNVGSVSSSYGSYSSILSGAGDDKVSVVSNAAGVTINGGSGNDTIYSNGKGNIFQYAAGDGNDVIYNLGTNDTLNLTSGSISSISASGSDATLHVGSNTITFKGAHGQILNLLTSSGLSTISLCSTPMPDNIEPETPHHGSSDTDTSTGTSTGTSTVPASTELKITGKSTADKINNTLDGATISALGGPDTITNSGNNVSISGGIGNDSIKNTGDEVSIAGDAGNDVIISSGNNAFITGGAGTDKISLISDATDNTVNGGAGNDTIYSNGKSNLFTYGASDGKDVIYGFSADDSIKVTANKNITTGKSANNNDVVFYIGGTSNSITLKGLGDKTFDIKDGLITMSIKEANIMELGSGANEYTNYDDGEEIYGEGGKDTIINEEGSGVLIDGGAGADKLVNYGNEVTMYGGADNDTLISNGTNVYIDGGAGADRISLDVDAEDSTILGGTGNDTIYLNDNAHLIQYAEGDGNDVINGFIVGDSIQVTEGSITSAAVNKSNIILTVGSNKITIKGIGEEDYTIKDNVFTLGKSPVTTLIVEGKGTNTDEGAIVIGSKNADTITNTGNRASISSGAGNDKIVDSANETTVLTGAGKDTILSSGSNILVDSGADADRISIGADVENATIIGGTGNDNIYLNDNAQLVQYAAGDGKDTIYNFSKGDSIQVTSGEIRESVNSGSNKIFYIGSGTSNAIVIKDGASEDFVIKNNVIKFYEPPVRETINGSAKAEKITNEEDYRNILGNGGADTIINSGDQAYIDGGAANDIISITGGANHTLKGGAGNDTIYSNGAANLIQYASGQGNDVIYGFSETDSLQIDGTIKGAAKSGNDYVVTVGSGKITLKELGNESFTIQDGILTIAEELKPIELTKGNDKYTNETAQATIQGIGGVDTIINSANDALIDGGAGNDKISVTGEYGNNTLVGGAGNDMIYTNGKGNIIQYASGDGNDTIVGFSGDDSIQVTRGTITGPSTSGKNLVYKVGSNSIVIKDGASLKSSLVVVNNVIAFQAEAEAETLTSSADKYTVSADDATVYAVAGNDTLYNAFNNAYLDGGAGNDKISLDSASGNNTLLGGKGNDTIYTSGNGNLIQYASGDGNDTIVGFSGDDSIEVTSGTITGPSTSGKNLIYKVGSSSIVIKDGASLKSAIAVSGNVITFKSETEPEAETLTSSADKYTVTANDATVYAVAGKDTLYNAFNNAYLDGGAGDDKISLGADAGNNTLVGGKGNDTIYTNGDGNLIQYASGDGKDVIVGFSGDDSIQVTSGTIRTSVKSGNNTIFYVGSGTTNAITVKDGQTLNLTVNGNVIEISEGSAPITIPPSNSYTNADEGATIYGTASANTINNSGAKVYIDVANGNDKVISTADEVTIEGGAGNDTLFASGKNLSISGGAGTDKISIASDVENATINGGAGNDTISLNGGNANIVQYAAGAGKDVIYGFGISDSIQLTSGNVSRTVKNTNGDMMFTISGSASNVITVKDAADYEFVVEDGVITATTVDTSEKTLTDKGDNYTNNSVNETIYALKGNDTLYNYGEAAYIDLGAGNDKLTNSANEVIVIGDAGNDTIITSGSDGEIDAGAGADKISLGGSATNNTITAGAGNDTIYSNANGNIFQYASGKDVIVGFGGDDTLIVEDFNHTVKSGSNVVVYSGSGSSNTITLKNFNSKLAIEDGVITVGKAKVIDGSSAADNLTNEDAEATINALGGNDTIENSANSVLINGGAGNDSIYNTGNEVTINGDAGKDTIEAEGNSLLIYGGAADDVISLGSDAENVTISGGAGNDKIYGNSNAVVYQYGSSDGKDIIYGFTSNDTLQLTSGSVSKATSNGNLGLVTIGSNVITLEGAGGSTINIMDTSGTVTKYNLGGVLPDGIKLSANGKNMTVTSAFKGDVVDLPNYEGTDDVEKVNATAVKTGISIVANDNGVSINAGSGNDTLIGGKGDDTLYGGGGNDVFVYSAGYDVIRDYTANKDTIMFAEDVEYEYSEDDGTKKILHTTKGDLTLLNGADKDIAVIDYEGNEIDVSELLADDNFVTDELNLDSISEVTATNYSVGKLEDAATFGNLTNDTLAAVYTYTDK